METLRLASEPKISNIISDPEQAERIRLLSEENHVLFQEITLLRTQLEHVITEYNSKT